MYTYKDFYRNFQINYFDYKQSSNQYLLRLSEEELSSIAGKMIDYTDEEFRRALKIDVRLTYLLAIDTLFELIFALLPGKKLELMDKEILNQLTKGNPYLKDLQNFLNGKPSGFDRLKYTIKYTKGKQCSVLRYIFFDGVFETDTEEKIVDTIEVFKNAIMYFGREIIDNREEMNSIKHGMRVTPFLKHVSLTNPDNKEDKLILDMEETISFQTKKKDIRTIHLKQLDYKRDIQLTYFVSNMIFNLISIKKHIFSDNRKKEQYTLMLFPKDSLQKASISNITSVNFKINLPVDKVVK